MATYVRGVENDLTVAQTQRVRDVRNDVAVLEPEASPFTTLTTRMGTDTTFSVKKEWLEDELPARFVKFSSTLGCGDSTPVYSSTGSTASFLNANDSAVICVDDLLRSEKSGEVVLVTAIGTGGATRTNVHGAAQHRQHRHGALADVRPGPDGHPRRPRQLHRHRQRAPAGRQAGNPRRDAARRPVQHLPDRARPDRRDAHRGEVARTTRAPSTSGSSPRR
jgi:hypothetical protein